MNERLWWMARDSSWGFPSSSTTCGTKRPADDCDLDGDQPLAKKFGHLHLGWLFCFAFYHFRR